MQIRKNKKYIYCNILLYNNIHIVYFTVLQFLLIVLYTICIVRVRRMKRIVRAEMEVNLLFLTVSISFGNSVVVSPYCILLEVDGKRSQDSL